MSRFGYDYYDEMFNNQGALWWANVERAMSGARGQAALLELYRVLDAMPDKRLISGRLADEAGHVCAVGALVTARRVAAGEDREAVLRDLAAKIVEDDDYMGSEITASEGKSVGLTFSLAWGLASLNDYDFGSQTPEERHASVMRWLARKLKPVPA